MFTHIHNPALGKLRVIGFVSESGDTLWKAYELQKEMEQTYEGCPFEIVGVFCGKAGSAAEMKAKELGIPSACIDNSAFFEQRGKPVKDMDTRREYDAAALELIRSMEGNAILLSGYCWVATDCLLDEYIMMNVYPEDLPSQKERQWAYIGDDGAAAALAAREPNLCSTSYLATKQVNDVRILIVSERIPVDYSLHSDDEARKHHYLKLAAQQSGLVGARTLLEVASGNFEIDDGGEVYYKGQKMLEGLRIENWEENKPLHERATEKLLYPESIAVFGASMKPGIGRSIIENMLNDGYIGKIFAINLRGEDVHSVKGYKSISEIGETIDLAIIVTPKKVVLDVAEECGRYGVKAITCVSAGFKETGAEGAADENELAKIVNRYNMRMLGPNCMGFMSAKVSLNCTFLSDTIYKGNIALLTQSGAIGAVMLDFVEQLGLGFSSIISLGNQADINVCDLLPYYDADEQTKVIILYLESIIEPRRFLRVASAVKKPILLLKSGSSEAGMAATSSHTGSLAGSDDAVEALAKKAGLIRVHTLEACFVCAAALTRMPMVKGDRVALITNAGGPGVQATDTLSHAGFKLPEPSEKVQKHLREHLMPEASVRNPIDIIAAAPPEHYAIAAKAMIESGEYDVFTVVTIPPASVDITAVARALAPVLKDAKIPVVTSFVGPNIGRAGRKIMLQSDIPVCLYPEQLATILRGMKERKKHPTEEPIRPPRLVVNNALSILESVADGEYLPAGQVYALLDSFGITTLASGILTSMEDAVTVKITFPVAAKIEHPEIIHKSDVGGVRLNIKNREELAEVIADFLKRFPGATGVFVQEMAPSGIELIIGSVRDPQLGHSVMVGLGGVWVEVMKDVAFGYPPLGEQEALEIINSLRCEPLLAGYRGKPGVNKNALVELLQKVGTMLLEIPGIEELDLNPIVYDPAKDAFIAVDARIKKG